MTKHAMAWISLVVLPSTLFANHMSYRLLPGVDKNTVVVEETTYNSMEGFSSSGGSTILYSTKTHERHLPLTVAFDIGIRYQNLPILDESLEKLAHKGARIDIADALAIIADKLADKRSSKRAGYWAAGFLGALGCAIPFFDMQHRISAGHNFGPAYVGGSFDVSKHVMTGLMWTAAALTAIGSWLSFKNASGIYVDIIHRLLNSHVCIISSVNKFSHRLELIKKLLTPKDRERLIALIKPLGVNYMIHSN